MSDDFGSWFDGVDESEIRKERSKARELRRSSWWQNRLAKGMCYYCGKAFLPSELTMDHVVPLTRGGKSSKGNLVPCCKECNNLKKTLLPIEWEAYMARLDREGSQ